MSYNEQVVEELRKIREALIPKPTPAPPSRKKGAFSEFMDFIGKYGVLGLAVGFIMGTAVGKVVSTLVGDIIMPIPGAFVVGGDWRKAVVSVPIGQSINFGIGDFVGAIVDFLIIALVIFLIVRYATRAGLK